MYGPIGACLRNLHPDTWRPRRMFHNVRSASVGLFLSRRALGVLFGGWILITLILDFLCLGGWITPILTFPPQGGRDFLPRRASPGWVLLPYAGDGGLDFVFHALDEFLVGGDYGALGFDLGYYGLLGFKRW